MSTAVIGVPGFKARSGRTVHLLEDGTVTFDKANGYLSPATAMDAEEFFRAKRDAEVGRWRWPENPDYVVYAPRDFTHYVRVVDERGAFLEVIHREHVEGRGSLMAQAARAYFEAHPERKPWQNAEPGEIWVLTLADPTLDPVAAMPGGHGRFIVIGEDTGRASFVDSGDIADARCIWPEPVDAEIVEDES